MAKCSVQHQANMAILMSHNLLGTASLPAPRYYQVCSLSYPSMQNHGFALLPHDILLVIDSFLWPEDRYACLFVCRHWYNTFYRLFYHTVTISNVESCVRLAESLQNGDSESLLRNGIRHLCVDLRAADVNKAAKLPGFCPLLRSLQVTGRPGNSFEDYAFERYFFAISTQSWSSDIGLWQLPESLTRLSLSMPQLARESIFPVLQLLPRLTSLTLNWLSGYWSTQDMDYVHQSCPELLEVSISADSYLPAFRPEQEQQQQEEEVVALDSSEPATILESLYPDLHRPTRPKKLERLQIMIYHNLSLYFTDWFLYAARSYPNLDSFMLEMHPQDSPRVGDRPGELQLLSLLIDFQLIPDIRRRAEVPAFERLLQSCPRLRSFTVLNTQLGEKLLRALYEQRTIQHLGVTKGIFYPTDDDGNWLFSHALVSLTLQRQRFQAPPSTHITSSLDMIRKISLLPQLRHLHLDDPDEQQLELVHILRLCPQLETLDLGGMKIHPSHNLALEDTDARLHTVRAKDTVLPESFFQVRAPCLKEIVLKDCMITGERPPWAELVVPPSVSIVQLDNLSFRRYDPDITINTARRCFTLFNVSREFYDITESSKNKNDTILGRRPLASAEVAQKLRNLDNHRGGLLEDYGLVIHDPLLEGCTINGIRLLRSTTGFG